MWQTLPMHTDHPLDLTGIDRPRLVRAAARLLGTADAEDAVQDAYMRALEAHTDPLNVAQAWLLTVVRNLAVDRLRRRQWMQQWLAQSADEATEEQQARSAEADAALAEEVTHALRLLATQLTPEDGATVLLYAVFDSEHADIAKASGRSEPASRQKLRRALHRLQQAACIPADWPTEALTQDEDTLLRIYLQAMQRHDPQTLWALLRQPPVTASAKTTAFATAAPAQTGSSVQHIAGQLCLVLTLDGVTLCVLPLGAQPQSESQPLCEVR